MLKRTEDEILAAVHGPPKSGGEEVELGGRKYTIYPIKGRANSRWFRKVLGPIIEQLQGVAPLVMLYADKEDGVNIKLEQSHIESLVGLFKQLGGPHFDTLLDTVYRWCPEIRKDKDYLEGYEVDESGEILNEEDGEPIMSGEGATDQEFLTAFLVILRMVYGPFAQALGLQINRPAQKEDQKESSNQNGPNQESMK